MASKEKNLSNEKVHEVVDVSDSEANYEQSGERGETLKRTMKNRHIAMIRFVYRLLVVRTLLTMYPVLAVSSVLVFSWVRRPLCTTVAPSVCSSVTRQSVPFALLCESSCPRCDQSGC